MNRVTLPPEKNPMKRAPKLPAHPGGLEWSEQARDYWQKIWASPQASQFLKVQIPFLVILLVLMEKFTTSPNASLSREIRAWQKSFGLSPDDLRGLDWVVPSAEEPKPPAKAIKDRGDDPDPRSYLDGGESDA